MIGYPELLADGRLSNSAALCAHGQVQGVYRKHLLPNYAVFDEQRYFEPSTVDGPLFTIAGLQVALTVCEDAWSATGPVVTQAAAGAEVVVNINASPYYAGRVHERAAMLAQRAIEAEAPIVYVNLVGGQDELVFDGASMVVAADGTVLARGRQFDEDLLIVDVDVRGRATTDGPAPAGAIRSRCPRSRCRRATSASRRGRHGSSPLLDPVQEVYRALVLGTRDYVDKNGFRDVVIGLSGGIDSSLVAAIAVDALGPEQGHRRARCRRGTRARAASTDADALGRQPRHPSADDPDRAGARGVRRHARRGVRGHRARPRRGEPAGADPRHDPHGAVEQVRLARADDRQQERDGDAATRRSTATWPAASR